MKKIQIALSVLILSTGILMAQPASKPGKHSHGDRKEMAYEKLNLTDDQKAKMKTANDDFRQQMQALKNNSSQTVQQQKDARDQLMKQHKAQVESILTTGQKSQLKQMKAEGKMDKGQVGTKHFDKMKQDLNLTDQQVSQLKSNQESLKSKMEAIQNNTSLDQTAKMQQLKALREEQRKSMEQVLTPEQKEKWQGMKKDHPHRSRNKRSDYQAPVSQS